MAVDVGYVCYIPDRKEFISIPDKDGFMAFSPSGAFVFSSYERACQIVSDCRYNPWRLPVQVFKRTGNLLEYVDTVNFKG